MLYRQAIGAECRHEIRRPNAHIRTIFWKMVKRFVDGDRAVLLSGPQAMLGVDTMTFAASNKYTKNADTFGHQFSHNVRRLAMRTMEGKAEAPLTPKGRGAVLLEMSCS